ncbi:MULTISPECIES: hypothetical protein [unclassified Streptomyces]|uniref:hypothetical protein n=1 Tax=unclassified Streptomyces TaxID=2593676 RepID=UPI003D8DB8D7
MAEPVEEAENSGGGQRMRSPATRLLLGTAYGSVLLFGIAVSARVAAGLGWGTPTPLATTVLGTLGATAVTALAASAGRTLRGRSAVPRPSDADGSAPEVNGSASHGDEPPPRPGRERGDAP